MYKRTQRERKESLRGFEEEFLGVQTSDDDDDEDITLWCWWLMSIHHMMMMIQLWYSSTQLCVYLYIAVNFPLLSMLVYFIFNHHSITCLPLTSRFLFVIFIQGQVSFIIIICNYYYSIRYSISFYDSNQSLISLNPIAKLITNQSLLKFLDWIYFASKSSWILKI